MSTSARLSGSFMIGDSVEILKTDSAEAEANQIRIQLLSKLTFQSNQDFITYIKGFLGKKGEGQKRIHNAEVY